MSSSRKHSSRELGELARETRVLADEIAQGLRSNPERLNMPTVMTAILRGLRNQEAILEALASLSEFTPGEPARTESVRTTSNRLAPVRDDGPEGDALEIELGSGRRATPLPIAIPRELDRQDPNTVNGARARAVVEEFDQRDRSFDRGLSKLNAWLGAGGMGLPFQKREQHAYLNTGALSPAMLAHVEAELSGREGYSTKLGRLVVDGLTGEVVIYAKSAGGETR